MEHDEKTVAVRGRILLADDDELFRVGLARMLRSDGYDCVCAADGPQALELLNNSTYEALIADIFMPGNVGLELIQNVPQIAAGLPVILLTGRPSVETAIKSVNLSVAGYLVKPPDLNELRALLDKSIQTYRTCQKIAASRHRFAKWAQDLSLIEQNLRNPTGIEKALPVAEYLQLLANNFLTVMDEMEQSMTLLTRLKTNEEPQGNSELVPILQHTLQVLEQTKQNFKSKRLGRLRTELYSVLEKHKQGGSKVEKS